MGDIRDLYTIGIVMFACTLPLLFLLPSLVKPVMYFLYRSNSELRYNIAGEQYEVKAYYIFNRRVFEI